MKTRILVAVLAALTLMTAGLFAATPGASAETPTCPAGTTLDASGQCSAPATTSTTDAVVECPAGYTHDAAAENCTGPGVYTAAVEAGSPSCPAELVAAAANLQAAAGGTVTASVVDGNCQVSLVKVEPAVVNCPKDAPLLAGFISNGNGYCTYAASPGEPAIPAMCDGAAAPGTTAADCIDTDPIISISCADADAVLNGTSCETTVCATGALYGSACVSQATPKPAGPGDVPAAPAPAPAPAVSVPSGVTGPLVTTGSPSISTPIQPAVIAAAPAASSQLAVTGPTQTSTGVAVALTLLAFGAIAMIWSDFFGRRGSRA